MTLKILQKSRIWGPQVGLSWAKLGTCCFILGLCWAILELCWIILEPCWAILQPSWNQVEHTWQKYGKYRKSVASWGSPHRPKKKNNGPGFGDNVLNGLKINRRNFNQLEAAFRHPDKSVTKGVQIPSQLASCLEYSFLKILEANMTLKIYEKSRIWGSSWPKLAQVEPNLSQLEANLRQLGASWGHLGRSWGQHRAKMSQDRPRWAKIGPQVGPSWEQVRPSWGQDAPCWRQVGPCWPQVGPT